MRVQDLMLSLLFFFRTSRCGSLVLDSWLDHFKFLLERRTTFSVVPQKKKLLLAWKLAESLKVWNLKGFALRARLDGALAWACLPGNQSQPQATEIQRLEALPGVGVAWQECMYKTQSGGGGGPTPSTRLHRTSL